MNGTTRGTIPVVLVSKVLEPTEILYLVTPNFMHATNTILFTRNRGIKNSMYASYSDEDLMSISIQVHPVSQESHDDESFLAVVVVLGGPSVTSAPFVVAGQNLRACIEYII